MRPSDLAATPALLLALTALAACAPAPVTPPPAATSSPARAAGRAVGRALGRVFDDPAPAPHVEMQSQSKTLAGIVTTPLAKAFLARAALLPEVATRALHRRKDKSRYYEEATWQALPAEEKALTEPFPADEEAYYYTRYGSPPCVLNEIGRCYRPARPPGLKSRANITKSFGLRCGAWRSIGGIGMRRARIVSGLCQRCEHFAFRPTSDALLGAARSVP